MYLTFIFILFSLTIFASSAYGNMRFSVSGKLETGLVSADELTSYQNSGSGNLRWDESGLKVQQAFLKVDANFSRSWSGSAVVNAHEDGRKHLGFTQAFIEYKPLTKNKIKRQFKAGFFYPELSVENTDAAWLSPYFFAQSAINSWVGEELRIFGGEYRLISSGRSRRSPWSWDLMAGLYKGNDSTGALLAWRGFAMHDRQSLHHDRLNFMTNPVINNLERIQAPSWVEPFREIDTRWGAYLGAHVKYLRKSELRYYYYDNNADPTIFDEDRMYAWHTKFHSLSFQHQLSPSILLFGQGMSGSTLMGPRMVFADFYAGYIALSYQQQMHRVSLRFDRFQVNEDDRIPQDPNDSDGKGITINYRYKLSDAMELGVEMHANESSVANRVMANEAPKQKQSQALLVFSYTF